MSSSRNSPAFKNVSVVLLRPCLLSGKKYYLSMFYSLYSEDGNYVGTWDPVCKEICYDGPKDRRVKKVFEECEMEEEGTWNLLLRSKGKNLNGIMTLDGNIIYTKQRVPYCRCVSDSESRTYILSELIDETKVNGLGDLFQEISL